MIPNVPPVPDDPLPQPHPDYDISIGNPRWRRRLPWGALRRLSILCRIMALFTPLVGLAMALISIADALRPRYEFGYNPPPYQAVSLLIMGMVYAVGAVFAVFFWFGMAELLNLFIAMERSTRVAAARLSQRRRETPVELQELVEEPD